MTEPGPLVPDGGASYPWWRRGPIHDVGAEFVGAEVVGHAAELGGDDGLVEVLEILEVADDRGRLDRSQVQVEADQIEHVPPMHPFPEPGAIGDWTAKMRSGFVLGGPEMLVQVLLYGARCRRLGEELLHPILDGSPLNDPGHEQAQFGTDADGDSIEPATEPLGAPSDLSEVVQLVCWVGADQPWLDPDLETAIERE